MSPVGEKPHYEQPVVYDESDLQRIPQYRLVAPAFMIEAVDDWKYVIRDSRTKFCLATVPGLVRPLILSLRVFLISINFHIPGKVRQSSQLRVLLCPRTNNGFSEDCKA